MIFATAHLRRLPDGRWMRCTSALAHFEVVRYATGAGRVYHVPSETLVVENAHLAPSARHLLTALEGMEHRSPQENDRLPLRYAPGLALCRFGLSHEEQKRADHNHHLQKKSQHRPV
jgi:hypothetical protein